LSENHALFAIGSLGGIDARTLAYHRTHRRRRHAVWILIAARRRQDAAPSRMRRFSCALARQMGQHRWYDADESPANRSKDSKHRSWKMCAHGSNT
jgi:hypothetical protein